MLDAIVAQLEELAELDTQYDVFGSWEHRYARKPVPSAELDALEAEHGVELPPSYRRYLENVGVGAGPSYGLLAPAPLARSDGRCARRGDLREPFPLDVAWCNTDPEPWPESINRYDGCIKLVELGCGYFDLIVVNGPHAGEIWTDWTAVRGAGRLEPLAASLFDWLDHWLSRARSQWARAELFRAVRRVGEAPSPRLLELTKHLEDSDDALGLGYRHLLLGRLEHARACFEESHRRHPAYGKSVIGIYWQSLCDLHRVRDDLDARFDAATRGLATRHAPSIPQLLWEKEDVLRQRGDEAGALEVLITRARSRTGVPDALKDCARALRDAGRLDELEAIIDQLVEARRPKRRVSAEEKRAQLDAIVAEALGSDEA